MPDSKRFLHPEAIKRISRLELRARHIVEGFLTGMHRSPYFGQSVEFLQHREYAVGDDLRYVDWKVWARQDRLYVKQFEEETNLRCTMLVDVSNSMSYGKGPLSKYEYACTVASSLAYLILRQHDAVGCLAFDDRIRDEVFHKGLQLHQVDELCGTLARYGFHLKCYFMQKPVPDMSDTEAVQDIQRAIDYLAELAGRHGTRINLHLNPTYVAFGTALERSFRRGEYTPPQLADVARAALHAEGKPITLYVGLSDEDLACEGGSFVRPGDEALIAALERFNRSQDFAALKTALATASRQPGQDAPPR